MGLLDRRQCVVGIVRALGEHRLAHHARDLEQQFDPFAAEVDDALDDLVGDDLLRLIFTACHPVVPMEGRVALVLRCLGGLSTEEIARAFLVPSATAAQRIVRAKRTLTSQRVRFELPAASELAQRLASVLEVVYLMFNEGYSATAGSDWMRPALMEEALRLGRLLASLAPGEPEVHGLAALMELQASRARIVAAADAARRRIERNLHDGAQQRLVALAVKLRLASRLVDTDPGQTRGMLDELRDEVKDAVEELRSLAHGIYPPLLMDQGLAAALGSAAQRATIPTRVEAGSIGRYSSEMEAAAYFCCLEALQNAMKHAGPAATVIVRVWEEAGALRFSVSDDGAGFDPAAKGASSGFVNMRDRLGAIGGWLQVESSLGAGTSVLGVLPLAG